MSTPIYAAVAAELGFDPCAGGVPAAPAPRKRKPAAKRVTKRVTKGAEA